MPPPTAPTLSPETRAKADHLSRILTSLGSVAVAYSGGVDSTLLLAIAHDHLGARCVAVGGLSATYAEEEVADARELAARIGCEYVLLDTMELSDSRYADNTHQRCYFCKQELYGRIAGFAAARGLAAVIDGTNADDLADFRPGRRAARELGVRSPLLEAGLTKAEIRQLSVLRNLPTADKPATACLSSRFQFGDPITVDKLRQVAAAETAIRRLGFSGFRVRHHGETARLEVRPEDLPQAIDLREDIVLALRQAGYRYITLDLEGYRTGSGNAAVPLMLRRSSRTGPSPDHR